MMNPDQIREQLSLVEQNREQFEQQERSFHQQLTEIGSVDAQLTGDVESYKLIGNIMVKKDNATLKKELDEKKETLKVRLAAIEKQEEKLKQKQKELQELLLNQKEQK